MYTMHGSIKVGRHIVQIQIRYYLKPVPSVTIFAERERRMLLQKSFPLKAPLSKMEKQRTLAHSLEEFLRIFREKMIDEAKHWVRMPIAEPLEEGWYEKREKLVTKIVALQGVRIAALIGEEGDIVTHGLRFFGEKAKVAVLWKRILGMLEQLRVCGRFGALRSFLIEGDQGTIFFSPLDSSSGYFVLLSPGTQTELTRKGIEELIAMLKKEKT